MIRLARPAAPVELSDAVVQALTARFAQDKTERVWAQDYILVALAAMSHGKCAYCEALLTEESKYIEVDHFRCKANHPELVVHWDNLLPACKRCNGNKSNHDVDVNGALVDPSVADPREHMYMLNFRLHPKTPIGDRTIDVLYLNQSDRVVLPRFQVGTVTAESVERLLNTLERWEQENQDRFLRRLVRSTAEVLKEAIPPAEYSATSATVLIQSPGYADLKARMTAAEIWSEDLEGLDQTMRSLALTPP
jgi:uncharacterized protein (TIGR02646 family)